MGKEGGLRLVVSGVSFKSQSQSSEQETILKLKSFEDQEMGKGGRNAMLTLKLTIIKEKQIS